MTTGATRCAHCETPIADPTTQVVHGDKTYCCANCSSAMEQAGSGSDPRTRAHEGSLRCAHCGVAIVDESSMQSRGNQAFCCPNCLDAIDTEADDASLGPSAEQLPADDRARQMR
jgi:uncharacterized CHY-type Zn-finger protein